MYHKKMTAALAIAVLGSTSAVALADEPGEGWITFEQAMEKAKAAGYTELHSLEVDDKSWEGKGLKADGKRYEFQMEGTTGKITVDEED